MTHFSFPRLSQLWLQLLVLLASLTIILSTTVSAAEPLPRKVFQNLQAGKKQTVIVYGTSLTHGGAWAIAMKDWFEAHYPGLVTFLNSAGPGQNSDWGLANLNTRVLAHQPDLVLIEFAYNDAHEKFAMPVPKGGANLEQIVHLIQEQRPNCEIVLQVMNVGWDAPNGNRSQSARPQLAAFNDNYRSFAAANALPLIDHFPAWLKLKETDQARYRLFVPDGTHPNKEGSLAVTWPAVKALLERAEQSARK